MDEARVKKVEAKVARILPIPPQAVSNKWDAEEVRVEAEKWCKPFCCRMCKCMEVRKRTEQEAYECSFAQQELQLCVSRVSDHIKGIQAQLKK